MVNNNFIGYDVHCYKAPKFLFSPIVIEYLYQVGCTLDYLKIVLVLS